ncbi:carbon monoxide dehydrogenase [Variovorax sp. WS11]|uniref:FAD binding domain-containing protein n=1 Tax=Variovorax sp. WS11 TaxID=1105204 RepID=UPI000D0CCDDC|nr:xanthine dehydrogenase family protein subunit M [Variovorax sp. WS11]NDZ17489.1 xanthine dehydrogenase family protein subunit M [Variovorax sp. WS11]PSL85978.1 carbon monoxide dehydrogenase [Variovorax sp. WS11]
MYAFDYQRPGTTGEALAAFSGDANFLAGGQSLVQAMKLRMANVPLLIDLGGIPELRAISVTADAVAIGAMTRHAEVAHSAEVQAAIPALAGLAGGIADPMVRNMGTLGGSLANADPAACYPAAALGLGATIRTDRRSIPADDFFVGLYQTLLEPGELIVSVSFPRVERAGYVKFKHPASRFAVVGAFVSKGRGGIRVAINGAKACVFRATEIERALAKDFTPQAAASVELGSEDMFSDMFAGAEYRAALVSVMASRAVEQALPQDRP